MARLILLIVSFVFSGLTSIFIEGVLIFLSFLILIITSIILAYLGFDGYDLM